MPDNRPEERTRIKDENGVVHEESAPWWFRCEHVYRNNTKRDLELYELVHTHTTCVWCVARIKKPR